MAQSERRIPASRAVLPDGVVGPVEIVIDEGRIVAVDTPTTPEPAPDRLLVPGFVDLQMNGAANLDVGTADDDGWDHLDAYLLAHGTTAWCPTLTSRPFDRYATPLDRAAERAEAPPAARPGVLGVHLEGPFLAVAGAHNPAHLAAVDLRWLASLPEVVRLVTLSPELESAARAVAELTRRGIVAALGHSAADLETARACVDAGAQLVTHCFNVTGRLHQRAPGLTGVALTDDRLSVSLIPDLIHVHPELLKIVLRTKGLRRTIAISDSIAWGAQPGVTVVDGAPRTATGALAGSMLTMDVAFRNLVASGFDLIQASWATATAPARLVGAGATHGQIAPGARADLVGLDDGLAVTDVWVAGVRVGASGSETDGGTGGEAGGGPTPST